jgi:hypothetical protein
MTLIIINQIILRAPFQTIHNPIPYMRYRSKPSTFPIHTPSTDHNPNRTLGTFPTHPHSQSIHEVPFPSHPHSQSVRRVPCQATTGQLTSRRMEDYNSTSNKTENLNKVSFYINSNESTITKTAGLSKTILHRHKSSIEDHIK